MKRTISVACIGCLVMSVLLYTGISSAQEMKAGTLVASGKSEVVARADRAEVIFTLKGTGSSMKEALDEAKKKLVPAFTRLMSAGVSRDSLSTSYFEWTENLGKKAIFTSSRDFRARIKVLITFDRLDLIEPAILAVSGCEPEYIGAISYSLKDESVPRRKAMELAIMRAKENARTMAEKAGVVLGPIVSVKEVLPKVWLDPIDLMPRTFLSRPATPPEGTVLPQNIKVSSEVLVTYRIAP